MSERVKLVIDIDSITYLDCLTDVQENIPCSTLEKAVADGKFVHDSSWIVEPKTDATTYDHIKCVRCGAYPLGDVPTRYCACCGARMVNTSFGTKPAGFIKENNEKHKETSIS